MKQQLNTIKFKLTLWFGALIIFASLSSILILNSVFAIDRNRPAPNPQHIEYHNLYNDDYENLIQQRIRADREATQTKLIIASLMIIAFEVLFASISSYYVIRHLLSPLNELNNLIKEVNEKVLYTQIKFNGRSEEFNELVTNFNEMMQRLNIAFENQKQFVQNVSHEIKTPLTIIKTNLEALLIDKNAHRDEIDAYIKTSIDSINNLNSLTEDLLLLSLLNKGKIQFEEDDLESIINSVIKDLRHVAKDKNMILIQEGKTDRKIHANKTLLKRAFSNIIENSIKYSPKNTEIKVSVMDIENNTIINIQDKGHGIPQELLQKVFDRFFRVDNSRSRDSGGTGLGLAITKEIIDLHKGKIQFQNMNPGLMAIIEVPTHN